MTWWIMGFRWYGFRYIPAEGPCWKGEIDLGWVTIGWQGAPASSAKEHHELRREV